MKFEDLKQGDYVHWVADRMFKGWDTYGCVVKKTNDAASIQTYDDFKVTDLSVHGEAISEITVVEKRSAIAYVNSRIAKLNGKIFQLQADYNNAVSDVNHQIEKLKEVLP